MIIFNKKAAMFGLDARIALVIFGALSVISGASLYSAIQDAKVTALISEMNEVGKAWEQYMLDTGENIPATDATATGRHLRQSSHLFSASGVAGWKGPYVNFESNSNRLVHPKYEYIYISLLNGGNTWGGVNHWTEGGGYGYCTPSTECYVWINYHDSTGNLTEELAKALDSKIDNSDGSTVGKFKWYYNSTHDYYDYYFNYAPIKEPS